MMTHERVLRKSTIRLRHLIPSSRLNRRTSPYFLRASSLTGSVPACSWLTIPSAAGGGWRSGSERTPHQNSKEPEKKSISPEEQNS